MAALLDVLLPALSRPCCRQCRLGVVFCLLASWWVEMFAGVRGMGYVRSSYANGFQSAGELFRGDRAARPRPIAIVLALDHLNASSHAGALALRAGPASSHRPFLEHSALLADNPPP